MAERTPVRTQNLDRYGNDALPWGRAHDQLVRDNDGTELTHFLGTVGPDGRPHVAGVGAVWLDGDLYFTSGPAARKARNLAANRTIYRGADGQQSLVLTAPGQYQVSDEKATQLTTDFPREFALVVEQTPVKVPSVDATIKKVETATKKIS